METKGSEKEMSEIKQNVTKQFSDASVKEMCIKEVRKMFQWYDRPKNIEIVCFRSMREKSNFPYAQVDVRISYVATVYLEDIKKAHFSYLVRSKDGFEFKYTLSIDDLKDMI